MIGQIISHYRITSLRPEVPQEVEKILSKLLVKNPNARCQSASEVLADLRPLAQAHGLGFKIDTTRAAKISRSNRLVKFGAVAALLVALVVTGLLFLSSPPQAIDSVAVLPFTNLSPNPNAEYLSDGITESLIYSLSQLPKVKVMSRNAVFRYKGRATDAQAAGEELGVKAVLVGTVLQRDKQLSVSVELVDPRDRSVIWGENYHRPFADILALQSDITAEITAKMRPRLSPAEQRQLQKQIRRATQIDSSSDIIAMLARAYALVGKRREALQVLEEMQAWPRDRFVAPSEIVKVYLALGDKKQALAWLEKAYATHSFLNTLKVDAEFDPLRAEPRFEAILRKLGLD